MDKNIISALDRIAGALWYVGFNIFMLSMVTMCSAH